jgi:hypothetical protein
VILHQALCVLQKMSFPDRFAARAAGTLVLAGFPDGGSTSPIGFQYLSSLGREGFFALQSGAYCRLPS